MIANALLVSMVSYLILSTDRVLLEPPLFKVMVIITVKNTVDVLPNLCPVKHSHHDKIKFSKKN